MYTYITNTDKYYDLLSDRPSYQGGRPMTKPKLF